ncbi:uncharacterized protein METZ01_LOCUS188074, partial [marine metagenome]
VKKNSTSPFLLGLLYLLLGVWVLQLVSCTSTNTYVSELYPWLRNGKSKTEKYEPKAWMQRKCRGCKYDPSIWL